MKMTTVNTTAEVIEMNLCEIDQVFLKPDQLYVFRLDPACEDCVAYSKALPPPKKS